MDLYIPRDAPFSLEGETFPRLAESAAPAAICCFFDFAGILIIKIFYRLTRVDILYTENTAFDKESNVLR